MTFLKASPRLAAFRPAAFLGLLASLFLLWACHVSNEEAAFLNVKADSTWTKYDSIRVVLADTAGNHLDTLFEGPLTSPDQLKKLDAKGFDGGKVHIIIIGYLDDEVAKRETRPYDGQTGQSGDKIIVVLIPIDPDPDPDPNPKELDIKPDAATIYTGGPALALAPAGTAWTGKTLDWSSDKPAVATVDKGSVKAVAPGKAWIKAVSGSLKDSSEITVVTDTPELDAGADTTVLVGTSAVFQVKVKQEYGGVAAFKWSLDGDTAWDDSSANPANATLLSAPSKAFDTEGELTVRFQVRDGEGNIATASRKVTVAKQAPKITSLEKGAEIHTGDSLAFTAQAEVSPGLLKKYTWDYGDETPAVSGALSIAKGEITGGHRFAKQGDFKVTLTVEDDLGNKVSSSVNVSVLSNAPVANAGSDTTVEAGTRINLHGKAAAGKAKVAKTEWKIGAAGTFAVAPAETSFTASAAGGETVVCTFRITDEAGLTSQDDVQVTVKPSADADLNALTTSQGALAPAFARNVTAYNVNVGNGVPSITVTPTASNPGATIRVNGTVVASAQASGALALNVGPNNVTVEVTAKSGAKKSYILSVDRAASAAAELAGLAASAGPLSPAFAAGTLSYAVSATDTATTITATLPSGSPATLKINGANATSGTASASISLPAGQTTTIPVVVTAQNGATQTYNIAFTVPAGGKPDLVFTAATLTSKTATRVNYSYTIKNEGTAGIADLYNVSIQNFYSANQVFNDAGDAAAGGAILGIHKALAPGESHSGTFYSSGAVPAGLTYLTFKIDWGDSVSESDETNNTVSRQVLIAPVANAGADTTVAAGSAINLHGKSSDPLGTVVKTEWKIGTAAFVTASPDTTFASPSIGATTFTCIFRVTDEDGLTHEDPMTVTVSASADADLSSLVPSTGTLSPAFAKATTAYTMSVANGVASMTLTPTADNSAATIKVNTVTVASGAASGNLALAVGANTLTVEVTAQSGLKKNYVVTVTRAGSAVNTLSNLTATAGALSPAFASGTLSYTVNTSSTSTTVTPTVTAGSGATVTVNGTAVASGAASASISLPSGTTTTVNVVVTAQNGTTRTYAIAFTVPGSTLADLVVVSATITNVAPDRYDYTYTIKNNGGTSIPDLFNVSIQNFYSVDQIFNNTGDDPAGGSILGARRALAPGESYTGNYAAHGAPPAGMKYITWKIDWGEIIAESNENNNTVAIPLP